MHVSFCCVCFSFPVLSQEIGWEERLQNDLFCVGLLCKTLTQSVNPLSFLPAFVADENKLLACHIFTVELLREDALLSLCRHCGVSTFCNEIAIV